ncbi:hypothetical protein ILUMI_02345 [Ignelater luminosus]|uniref:Transmembrane protein 242 n=1 Tax=Ignelater luminosus TaxID=2038154 RepID=A0A8K0DGN4_IGNLU|nr:hypothetical protein ILUMI_02345 [Ignelater luminosus]
MSKDFSNEKILEKQNIESKDDVSFKVKAGIFLASVTGMSAIIGFGATLAAVKRQDPKYFNKGMLGTIEMTETGTSLALRALGWGTVYAVTGCGILFYTIWKLSGAQTMEEFRYKIGSALPKIPKNPPQGRTEFSGLNDLMGYLAESRGSREK